MTPYKIVNWKIEPITQKVRLYSFSGVDLWIFKDEDGLFNATEAKTGMEFIKSKRLKDLIELVTVMVNTKKVKTIIKRQVNYLKSKGIKLVNL